MTAKWRRSSLPATTFCEPLTRSTPNDSFTVVEALRPCRSRSGPIFHAKSQNGLPETYCFQNLKASLMHLRLDYSLSSYVPAEFDSVSQSHSESNDFVRKTQLFEHSNHARNVSVRGYEGWPPQIETQGGEQDPCSLISTVRCLTAVDIFRLLFCR